MAARQAPSPNALRWDVFCRVIDNFGDAGTAWRLARQLVRAHGRHVTLWIDVPRVLSGMSGAPTIDDGTRIEGVTIRCSSGCTGTDALPDVIVEVLGCGLPPAYRDRVRAAARPPQWFILEYLSAEPWVDAAHGKPSPDPATGIARRFWFPGFTPATGGVLREHDLLARRDAFLLDRRAQAGLWQALRVQTLAHDALRISLFAYPHAPITAALDAWSEGTRRIACFVPEVVASGALAPWCGGNATSAGSTHLRGALTLHVVPFVTQDCYDELLWACDFNFVRGEDSFVRAQWAARPLAWHIYRQDAAAHHAKLLAFLDLYGDGLAPDAEAALRALWTAWNGISPPSAFAPAWEHVLRERAALTTHAGRWAERLRAHADLAQTLLKAAFGKV